MAKLSIVIAEKDAQDGGLMPESTALYVKATTGTGMGRVGGFQGATCCDIGRNSNLFGLCLHVSRKHSDSLLCPVIPTLTILASLAPVLEWEIPH